MKDKECETTSTAYTINEHLYGLYDIVTSIESKIFYDSVRDPDGKTEVAKNKIDNSILLIKYIKDKLKLINEALELL